MIIYKLDDVYSNGTTLGNWWEMRAGKREW
jgi:hypothetical protein